MSRASEMLAWLWMSPQQRATAFRDFAHREVASAQSFLMREGIYHGKLGPHDFQEDAIDRFARVAIDEDRDDDDAVDAAHSLIVALSYAARGSVPNGLLYAHACGSRVRATLLKQSWVSGKSGSVLKLNADGLDTIVDYFREVNKSDLMDRDEIDLLNSVPGSLLIYRGAKMKDDLRKTAWSPSWTRDINTARWFAEYGHGDGPGVVMAAEIPKDAILALWETSGREPEVVVNPRRLRRIRIVEELSESRAALAA